MPVRAPVVTLMSFLLSTTAVVAQGIQDLDPNIAETGYSELYWVNASDATNDGIIVGMGYFDVGRYPVIWDESGARTVLEDANTYLLNLSYNGKYVAGYNSSTRRAQVYDLELGGYLDVSNTVNVNTNNGPFVDGDVLVYTSYDNQVHIYDLSTEVDTAILSPNVGGPTLNQSSAYDLSADGSTIVGVFRPDSTASAWLPGAWNTATGTGVALNLLSGANTGDANAISNDASIIAGTSVAASDTFAVYWDSARAVRQIHDASKANWSRGELISGDGAFVYGRHGNITDSATQAFRYDISLDTFTPLSLGFGGRSGVYDISDSGIAVGYANNEAGAGVATLWNTDGTFEEIGLLSSSISAEEGGYSWAEGISPDGSIIVGTSSANGENWEEHPFIYRTLMLDLENTQQSVVTSSVSHARATQLLETFTLASLGREVEVESTLSGLNSGDQLAESFAIRFDGAMNTNRDLGQSNFASVTVARALNDGYTMGGSLSANNVDQSNDAFGFNGSFNTVGMYLRSKEASTGLTWKASVAYTSGDAELTRKATLADTEEGVGTAGLSALSVAFDAGFAQEVGDNTTLSPYFRLAQNVSTREAYTEQSGIDFPLSYDDYKMTSQLATFGLDATINAGDKTEYRLGAGIEQELTNSNGSISGSSEIPGLTSFEFAAAASENKTRPFVSGGFQTALSETKSLTGDIQVKKGAYSDAFDVTLVFGYEMRF